MGAPSQRPARESPEPTKAPESEGLTILGSIESTVRAAVDVCYLFVTTSLTIAWHPLRFARRHVEGTSDGVLGPFSYVVMSAFGTSVVLRSLGGGLDRLPDVIADEVAKLSATMLVQTTIPVLVVVVVVGSLFSRTILHGDLTPTAVGGRAVAYAAGFQFMLMALLAILVQFIVRQDEQGAVVSGITLAAGAIVVSVVWPAAVLWSTVGSLRERPIRRRTALLSRGVPCLVAATLTLFGSILAAKWQSAPPENTPAAVLRTRIVGATNLEGTLELQVITWNRGEDDVWLAPDGHKLTNVTGDRGEDYTDTSLSVVDGGRTRSDLILLPVHGSTLLRLEGRLLMRPTGTPPKGPLKELHGNLALVRTTPDASGLPKIVQKADWTTR